ncbi:hypothetical protein SOCEGT47_015970 [Sorangium cellulosum]|uniref:Uncharacterized protein n=1 Tax=Sorangium cellulosum TaxID=56 RepID=A0A4P2PWH5_SORCE|nr:hypothetical protein [Sorangium cellulosum]AUX21119.1 hypothetical protein SOCEGT47_015970 [Sorangium cellulosum]
MAPQTSYSIYVRFRGRRLALMKHIRSLEAARAALLTLRADRFHDADQVFLVNDATKQIVDEARWEAGAEAGAEREISLRVDEGDGRGEPARDPASGVARPARADRAPALRPAREAPAEEAQGDPTASRWPRAESQEPPRARLRRALAAARAARARHDAALETLIRLQPSGALDEKMLRKLVDSARAVSDQSAHTLEQLERLLKHLERSS